MDENARSVRAADCAGRPTAARLSSATGHPAETGTWCRNRLSAGQAELVETWLPGLRLVNDFSWNLIDTAVLEVELEQRRYVIKAGGPSNHHIRRELEAHRRSTSVLAAGNRAPKLIHADRSLNILITEYLEGQHSAADRRLPLRRTAATEFATTATGSGALRAYALKLHPSFWQPVYPHSGVGTLDQSGNLARTSVGAGSLSLAIRPWPVFFRAQVLQMPTSPATEWSGYGSFRSPFSADCAIRRRCRSISFSPSFSAS